MRVISGSARGRRLRTVSGLKTRPTTDRVKESLFNILAHRVESAFFLDLFAGSGAIGIEALSRGAQTAIFIDNRRVCTNVINQNLDKIGFRDRSEVYTADVVRALPILRKRGLQFPLIFCDPPYKLGLTEKTISLVGQYRLLSPNGFLIAEHSNKEEIPTLMLNLIRIRTAVYGDTVLGFYINEEDKSEN